MFEHFTDQAIKAIMLAQEEVRRAGHNLVGTEQILLGLIAEGTGIAALVLREQGVTLKQARTIVEQIIGRGTGYAPANIPFTPKAKQVFELAFSEARQLGHNYIGTEHLLLGLARENNGVAAKVLMQLGVDTEKLRMDIIRILGEAGTTAASVGSRQSNPMSGFGTTSQPTTISAFSTNLTQRAREGKLDPVVGRETEIERTIQILGRRTKNNPVLVGEPGVGKTAIAEGLAQRIIAGDVPELIQDKEVISLDMGLMVAGTRFRGEFEERLKAVVKEVRESGNMILVIDEIHTLIGGGAMEGGMDAANMLKPALARGEIQCLGTTTLDEYRKYIERDAALERRFQPVKIGEPSVLETIEILQGLRESYETHHKVQIEDQALVAAAKLSDQYISDRFLPDKAIDLIDEAGSRLHVSHSLREKAQRGQLNTEEWDLILDEEIEPSVEEQLAVVDEEQIAHIVASWTGVPVTKLTEPEAELLLHMEDTLHRRLIGQQEAVTAVSRAIRRARVGLKNPNRPIASFIFSGPTGVGKTELTKALATYLFGSEDSMIRLDMSEFMERHTVSKLIGSPPGFVGYEEGGQLTEAIRRKPYSVLLLDEIEKAHPDVFNMLLQILEDGRLTDAKGRVVNFKNTLVIMTSNIGSKVIEKGGGGLGFEYSEDAAESQYHRIRNLVNEELKNYFRPEFLNRVDDIIVFRQLTKNEVKEIGNLLLREVSDRLTEQREIKLVVSEAFKDKIVEEGYDPSYGARPLRRAIMRLLEDELAEAILSGRVKNNSTALVDVNDQGQVTVLPAKERELQLVG
ncbi:MAG: ATP-dependent Clp protease ATP-binding subunit [Chroococcales cyanobacterium]